MQLMSVAALFLNICRNLGQVVAYFQLLLSGGCEGKPKPCTGDDCAGVEHAYCDTQLGVCSCKPGYEPQYDQHQLLLCSENGQTTSDDSNAQHKTGTTASVVPPLHQATASEDKIQSRFYYPRKRSYIIYFMRIGHVSH